ncbi:MAG: TPM domain-containing protein [Euryarchaeota archaeon]|nr:TPM domain-containing protein [Euryarchaeota archaeon]MBU4340766.1 TPM domain-containing protein [Euryarchaeota archaeon]MBU4454691.1 TPM domain-containing protein [Euryarchaeota archaeon]MCG2736773.1 TPM domain-containing protein [Candidatus Methanoperedenaceae archaeon]
MKWTWLIILMLLLPTASAVSYPQLSGYVTDNANMIDQSYETKITQLAGAIEKETTVQIAVVTIGSLEGEPMGMYAEELFKKAGIGKKDKDNGLLIVVAKQERDYRFEVGYGLEGTVTDSMYVNIGKRIIEPNFKNGEYGKGIYESMLVVQELVRGNPEVVSQYSMNSGGSGSDPDAFAGLFIILLVLVVGFIFFIAIMNSTYGGGTIGRRRYGYREPRIGWGMGGSGRYGGGGFGGGFGGGGGGFGGGFGGFGGGRSGGGGFGGKW